MNDIKKSINSHQKSKSKKQAAIILATLLITSTITGCGTLQNKISEYTSTKEQCELNPNDITKFSYKEKDYIILEETVSNAELGEWVGYIRQYVIADKTGRILDKENVEDTSLQMLEDLGKKETEETYMIPFLNVYATDETACLIVDANGSYHKAVSVENFKETDTVFQFQKGNQREGSGFQINPEDPTQLLCNEEIYQITSETVSREELGNYLTVLAQNITFDMDTKKILSKEESLDIDWTGEKGEQQRVNWVYKEVYEISGTDILNAVAVCINNKYHVAKRQ